MTNTELMALLPKYEAHTEQEIVDHALAYGWGVFLQKSGRNWVIYWDETAILPGVYKTRHEANEAFSRYLGACLDRR